MYKGTLLKEKFPFPSGKQGGFYMTLSRWMNDQLTRAISNSEWKLAHL